jgi:hypothetical protein
MDDRLADIKVAPTFSYSFVARHVFLGDMSRTQEVTDQVDQVLLLHAPSLSLWNFLPNGC